MEKFIEAASSDLLADAVPESLKNMLLVMDTAGIFQESEKTTNPLWDLTKEKLNAFLPNLMPDLFGGRQMMIPKEPQQQEQHPKMEVLKKENENVVLEVEAQSKDDNEKIVPEVEAYPKNNKESENETETETETQYNNNEETDQRKPPPSPIDPPTVPPTFFYEEDTNTSISLSTDTPALRPSEIGRYSFNIKNFISGLRAH